MRKRLQESMLEIRQAKMQRGGFFLTIHSQYHHPMGHGRLIYIIFTKTYFLATEVGQKLLQVPK